MQTFHPTEHGSQHIAHRQVIVIMCMEVEVLVWVVFLHLAHILDNLQRIQDTQGVGQHEPADTSILQTVHQLEYIVGRIFHSITPVFQIDIHGYVTFIGITHHLADVVDMFFRCFLQLVDTMFQRAFT